MKPIYRTLAAGAAAVLLAIGHMSSTDAYATYGRWGTLNVRFYVNPANTDVSQNAAISAVQTAMQSWNTQSGTAFQFSYAGQVSTTSTGYDNKNVIVFRNTTNGSSIASTYTWSSNGLLVDSDIVFWDGGYEFFTGSSGCSGGGYIEDIAAHELGHSMGLNHSSVQGATMYPSYSSCSTSARSLSSDDIAGAKALYEDGAGTPDTPPVVKILSPSNGFNAAAGKAVTFSGSAMDNPDGDISSKLTWKSNLEGAIGTGASISRALKAGNHTITATAKDSLGYMIATAIVVYVSESSTAPTNSAPTVTINNPASGATVPAGTSMTFSGSASDPEEGNVTARLVWRSSIDGQIGTGGSFTRSLTAGTHTITAKVTDSGGMTGQRSVNVSATSSSSSPSPSAPRLTARGYKEKGLQKVDLSWSGLTASSVDVYRSGSKITTTGNDGALTDSLNERGGGSYTYKVCAAGTSTCTNQATASF